MHSKSTSPRRRSCRGFYFFVDATPSFGYHWIRADPGAEEKP